MSYVDEATARSLIYFRPGPAHQTVSCRQQEQDAAGLVSLYIQGPKPQAIITQISFNSINCQMLTIQYQNNGGGRAVVAELLTPPPIKPITLP